MTIEEMREIDALKTYKELEEARRHITELEGRLRVLWDKLEGERKHYQERIKRLEAWIESLEILEQHSTVLPEREWFGSEIGYLRKGQFAYKGDAKP